MIQSQAAEVIQSAVRRKRGADEVFIDSLIGLLSSNACHTHKRVLVLVSKNNIDF